MGDVERAHQTSRALVVRPLRWIHPPRGMGYDKDIEAGDRDGFEDFRQAVTWLDVGDIKSRNMFSEKLGRRTRTEQAHIVDAQRDRAA